MSEMIRFKDCKMEGGWLMILPEWEDRGLAMAFIRKFKPGNLHSATLKKFQKKRSLDANQKMWALINELSAVLKLPPEEIYQGYIPDVGNNFTWHPERPEAVQRFSEAWCKDHIGRMVDDCGPCRSRDFAGYRLLKCYYGSSEYDTQTFSRLLDLVCQDCDQLGISTMSDRERSLLLDEWEATRNV